MWNAINSNWEMIEELDRAGDDTLPCIENGSVHHNISHRIVQTNTPEWRRYYFLESTCYNSQAFRMKCTGNNVTTPCPAPQTKEIWWLIKTDSRNRVSPYLLSSAVESIFWEWNQQSRLKGSDLQDGRRRHTPGHCDLPTAAQAPRSPETAIKQKKARV